MAARLGLFVITFIFVFLFATRGEDESPLKIVIWNVGQGQWVTWASETTCWHADMGGEFAPWREIKALCRTKANVISLSHWDSDHVSFLSHALWALPDSCVLFEPKGKATERKLKMLNRAKHCEKIASPFTTWSPSAGIYRMNSNDTSRIILWKGVLTPGDSSIHSESIWAEEIEGIESTKYLVLGHHGSRTSTGPLLLSKLPHLRLAIASSRFRRYRHPHIETVTRLRERHIPILTTEDWGNIHIFL